MPASVPDTGSHTQSDRVKPTFFDTVPHILRRVKQNRSTRFFRFDIFFGKL